MKENEITLKTWASNLCVMQTIDETSIRFNINDDVILELKLNGDIYIKGELIENNKQVVEGLKEFVDVFVKIQKENADKK